MTLPVGKRLGPYEIVAAVGAGGMGEVYRARDTRLDRTVAVKIIPEHLAADSELKQRFVREAQTISSFSHPHICHLYDVGDQDGTSYIVMEFMEGETLAARLAKGSIPIKQVLKIGAEIADALDKAHRQGIVHRDLKPANVMLTKSGAKLMDFGLAKPARAVAVAVSGDKVKPITVSTPTALESLARDVSPLTQKGTVVGTFQYMAPEVLQGGSADARSDIFSLGCVLYEMTTGKRAFEGKSQLSVLAAILEKDPDPVSQSQPLAPPSLDLLVKTCFAKDPEERIQTAHDLKLQLEWSSPSTSAFPAVLKSRSKAREMVLWGAVIVLLLLAFAGYLLLQNHGPTDVIDAVILPPDKMALDDLGDYGGPAVISPDGRMIVFAAKGPSSPKSLWMRQLKNPVAQKLEGTYGASFPFWSDDSRYVGFFANGKLNKISANGGPVTTLADAPAGRGGAWSQNTILFAPDYNTGIFSISPDGGKPQQVTHIDQRYHTTHRWPSFLPDGKHFLYFATNHNGTGADRNGIYFASLDGKENKLVLASDSPAQYAAGYLLFHSQTALMAEKFNPGSGILSGESKELVDRIQYDPSVWWTLFSVSTNGMMLYRPGVADSGTQLVWFDREGKQLEVAAEHGHYSDLRLSPDGSKLAVAYGTVTPDIWVFDLKRKTRTRLTFDPVLKFQPAWSPDGSKIAYSGLSSPSPPAGVVPLSGNNSQSIVFVVAANGVGKPEPLPEQGNDGFAYPGWGADGKTVYMVESNGPTGHSIYSQKLDSTEKPILVLEPGNQRANISDFRISPNGRWIAYVSDESDRAEVYVAPITGKGGKWQISVNGGDFPAWRADGKELFFFDVDDTLNSVDVSENGDEFIVGQVHALFHQDASANGVGYDASRDGKKFLFNIGTQDASAPLNLVVNWTTLLKK